MRVLGLGGLVLAAALAAGPAPIRAQSQSVDAALAKAKAALAAYQKKDCPAALRLIESRLDRETIALLPASTAVLVYNMAANCYLRLQDKPKAIAAAISATAFDEASDSIWRTRLGLQIDTDHPGAVATVAELARRRPDTLNSIQPNWLYTLERQLEDGRKTDLQRELLALLMDDAYHPRAVPWTKDHYRRDLALILLAQGETEPAGELVRAITDPEVWLEVAFDPQLGRLVPPDVDARAVVEKDLTAMRAFVAEYPSRLAPMIAASIDLRRLGRPQEALEQLALARVGAKDIPDFDDAREQSNWWWDAVGQAQEMLGDRFASIHAFTAGIDAGRPSSGIVAQRINLAHARNRFGEWRDALEATRSLDDSTWINPFGRMEMHLARACANAALEDRAALAVDVAYAREHGADHPEAFVDLLLCAGDMDAAAAALIAQLDDPQTRVRTRIRISDYDPPPPGAARYGYEEQLEQLKQRDDVRAAIARAGGIRRLHLQRMLL